MDGGLDDPDRPTRPDERWRPIVAALLDPRARRVLGEHLIADAGSAGAGDEPVPASAKPHAMRETDRRRAEETLRSAGLLTPDGEIDEEHLRGLLASRAPRVTGVDRWIVRGRIESWPSGADDRAELLRWALERVIVPDEHLGEREITERIAGLTRDPLRLRRAFVDAGLIDREADGTDYRRGDARAASGIAAATVGAVSTDVVSTDTASTGAVSTGAVATDAASVDTVADRAGKG